MQLDTVASGRIRPGSRFGKLTAVERTGTKYYGDGQHSRTVWRWRCDCGNEVVRSSANLTKNGKVHNCGCHSGGWAKGKSPANKSHNMSTTNLYSVWLSMKGRCLRPTNTAYKNYGGRGITVCDQWRSDFKAFSSWCTTTGHGPGLQLDRIDNDGPYSPENCRWVTRAQNVANRRAMLTLSRAEITGLIGAVDGALSDDPGSAVLRRLSERLDSISTNTRDKD